MENVDNIPVTVKRQSRAAALLNRVQEANKAGVPVPPPSPVQAPEPQFPETISSAPEAKEEFPVNPETPKAPAVATPPQNPEYVPEDPTDEIEAALDPKEKPEGQFKKLRTKYQTAAKELRERTVELDNLKKKIKDYDEGVSVAPVTQQQLARIAELEKYETLYNFKGSPVYREKFTAPLQSEHAKLSEIAKEYNINEETVRAALNAGSSADTNRILSQAFGDEVGALEAKSIIRNIKKIQSEAMEAEREPAQALARMQEDSDRIAAEQRRQANDVIANTARSGWSESLVTLREDPRFPELSFQEGNSEHNEKYVRPILTKAGQEYGKIVRALAENGLKQMPKDLSFALAKMTQLAHQSAVASVERDALKARVMELEGRLHITNGINRPGVNSTAGGPGAAVSSNGNKAVGPAQAARNVLSRVMSK